MSSRATLASRLGAGEFVVAGREREVRRRKAALLEILAAGPPAMPQRLLRLHALLTTTPVDLGRIARLLRDEPHLAEHLLRLCNSAWFGLRRQVARVEEAAILMGTTRLRSLVFASYLEQLSNARLPHLEAKQFCQHSVLTALLSETTARWLGWPDPERAYLGGLLHDVGKVPLLMVALREDPAAGIWLRGGAHRLVLEREYFGLDHCEVGRWLGLYWNLDPGQTEVLETHHHPEAAQQDPELVGVVALADYFCETVSESNADARAAEAWQFYHRCLPGLHEAALQRLLRLLEQQGPRLQALLESAAGEPSPAEI